MQEVIKYVVYDKPSRKFYKGSGQFCEAFEKAKLYNKVNHARSAITNYIELKYKPYRKKDSFEIMEVKTTLGVCVNEVPK